MPSGASNIGTWLLIIDVITFCSIFSNAGKSKIFIILLNILII